MDTVTNAVAAELGIVSPAPRHKPRAVTLTFIIFAICLIGLFAAAVAMSAAFTEADGAFIWVMVLMGATIITVLLAGVMVPFVKELRAHRR